MVMSLDAHSVHVVRFDLTITWAERLHYDSLVGPPSTMFTVNRGGSVVLILRLLNQKPTAG